MPTGGDSLFYLMFLPQVLILKWKQRTMNEAIKNPCSFENGMCPLNEDRLGNKEKAKKYPVFKNVIGLKTPFY
jgi:hypothetical protein